VQVIMATGEDHTEAMRAFARRRVDALAGELDGYVLKARSPSCGTAGVPVFDESGNKVDEGAGLFAAALRERCPDLPIVDVDALCDAEGQQEFLARVLAY